MKCTDFLKTIPREQLEEMIIKQVCVIDFDIESEYDCNIHECELEEGDDEYECCRKCWNSKMIDQ